MELEFYVVSYITKLLLSCLFKFSFSGLITSVGEEGELTFLLSVLVNLWYLFGWVTGNLVTENLVTGIGCVISLRKHVRAIYCNISRL